MAIQLITGADNLGTIVNKNNNNAKEQFITASYSNGNITLTKYNGSTVVVPIPIPVSGGQVLTYSGSITLGNTSGLYNQVTVTPLTYIFDSVKYDIVGSTTLNLTSGDSTLDRLDSIYIDTNDNTIKVETGTPANPPTIDDLDGDKILIGVVYVKATATASTPNLYSLIYSVFPFQLIQTIVNNGTPKANLYELNDVNASTAGNGQVLTYDTGSGKWIPTDKFSGLPLATTSGSGLTSTGRTIGLGGTLNRTTNILLGGRDFKIIRGTSTNQVDFSNSRLYTSSGILSIDYNLRQLKPSASLISYDYGSNIVYQGSSTSGNFNTRILYSKNQRQRYNYDSNILYNGNQGTSFNANTGIIFGRAIGSASVPQINLNNSTLFDPTGTVASVQWQSRNLVDSGGVQALNWQSRNLRTSGNSIRVQWGVIGQAALVTTGETNTGIGSNTLDIGTSTNSSTGLSIGASFNAFYCKGIDIMQWYPRDNVGGGVMVNTSGLNTSKSAVAALEINSTKQGLLLPRMTTTQRDAITSPPEGLLIMNLTTHTCQIRTNTAWVSL